MSRTTTNPFDDDHLHEEFAIFGIYGTNEANINTVLGLHALQHRSQETTGIVTFNGLHYHARRGHVAIGHNRYSTSGKNNALTEIGPFSAELTFGCFALAQNGNHTDASRLRTSLLETGSLFQSTSDTKIFVYLVARSRRDTVIKKLIDWTKLIAGAFSLVCIAKDMLIGESGPSAVGPPVSGTEGNAYVLASQTCALDTQWEQVFCMTSLPAK